ncbi:MAG: hypothetical protein LBD88_04885 [Candidatus Peribacteria bacterium]|nr:hypothetical protein [Candidatus Peribacteria bacterium]
MSDLAILISLIILIIYTLFSPVLTINNNGHMNMKTFFLLVNVGKSFIQEITITLHILD